MSAQLSLLPRMARVRQDFRSACAADIDASLRGGFAPVLPVLAPGAPVAVGVGSRGISNLQAIVRAAIDLLKGAGARPFIFPAMGSHGGATPEGQRELLASYGVTELSMGVSIRPSMEVRQVGTAACGAPVFSSVEALAADHIVLVNRIKPHTDFFGTLGSGLIKMSVIGLGKREGAAAMHVAASRLGHERVIREMARVVRENTRLLCGVGIIENQRHETGRVEVVAARDLEAREPILLAEARRLMPLLPFEEVDLLIVDRIGKNISGAGLDPNVTGRWVDGYSSSLAREGRPGPFMRRIFVRDLTPETHGNAIGIGLTDITTSRLAAAMDRHVTYTNALTALTPQAAKIPIYFDSDRECIQRAIASLAIEDARQARVVRIADTLDLEEFFVSEPLREESRERGLVAVSEFEEMRFDHAGNL